jgi:hypothetical protein
MRVYNNTKEVYGLNTDSVPVALSGLKVGDKITIVKNNDFGYPVAIHLKIEIAFTEDYAQYKDTLVIQGKQPRKRKASAYRFRPHESYVIYKDFIEINDHKKVISENNGVTVTNYGMCFDSDTFKAVNNNDHKKLVEQYKGA